MELVLEGIHYVPMTDVTRSMPACVDKASIPPVDTDVAATNLIKTQDEQKYTLSVAYPAMRADKAVAADGHIDFISTEALAKTAWEFLKKGSVTMHHQPGTGGHAEIVESYIWQGPDWEFTSPVNQEKYTVRKGDWMLAAKWDEEGWAAVKAGLTNGWSPEGSARRVKPTAERLAELTA